MTASPPVWPQMPTGTPLLPVQSVGRGVRSPLPRSSWSKHIMIKRITDMPDTKYVCEVLEENALLKIQNKELLARCDLLEAELCRFQCEIETIVMTLEE